MLYVTTKSMAGFKLMATMPMITDVSNQYSPSITLAGDGFTAVPIQIPKQMIPKVQRWSKRAKRRRRTKRMRRSGYLSTLADVYNFLPAWDTSYGMMKCIQRCRSGKYRRRSRKGQ